MSQSFARTTTTTTTSSVFVLYTGYLKTASGLLKFAQLVLGAVCVGLVSWDKHMIGQRAHFFFILMAVSFLIGTMCLLLSCLISFSTAGIISKTNYELIYHSIAFGLYFAASLTLLIESINIRYYTTASVIGLVVSILYLFSTILAYRSYRGL